MPQPEVIALRIQRIDAEITATWARYDAHVASRVNDPVERQRLRDHLRHLYLTRYIATP